VAPLFAAGGIDQAGAGQGGEGGVASHPLAVTAGDEQLGSADRPYPVLGEQRGRQLSDGRRERALGVGEPFRELLGRAGRAAAGSRLRPGCAAVAEPPPGPVAPRRAPQALAHVHVLVPVNADCHRPLHHLASFPSSWSTGLDRAVSGKGRRLLPAHRPAEAKRRRETDRVQGKTDSASMDMGHPAAAPHAQPPLGQRRLAGDTTQHGYWACGHLSPFSFWAREDARLPRSLGYYRRR
jgi:hypothetical protein